MAIIQDSKLLEQWNIPATFTLNIIMFAYICLFLYKYNLPSCRGITNNGQPLKVRTLNYKDIVLGNGKGE